MIRLLSDLPAVRAHNLSRVLTLIHRTGSMSRADLVRQSGLSATTISSLVGDLLASGFVHESGTGVSSGGRPPILLQFDYKFRHVLGVDIGATHIHVIVMDFRGDIVASRFCRIDVIVDPHGTIAAIRRLLQEVLDEAPLALEQISGLGVTIPTPLAGEKLDTLTTIYMPAWEGVDLLAQIADAFALPVYLDNDANAGAVAEKWWGQGQAYDNLAYIKLGVGVGSGLILNGEIYRGSGGTAGEIGHTTINVDGPPCRCGNRGCMESYVGANALVTAVKQLCQERAQPAAGERVLTVGDIAAAALEGDPVCSEVVQRTGAYLGTAIANLLNLLNPALIILGGDLVAAGDLLLDAVCAAVRQRAMPKASAESEIVISRLGRDAVAIGAATLAIQNAFRPSRLAHTLAPAS
ncbi:MAG: ROK family transcriptional regulator [Anaerolineae bacterium]|nr:ROK family transcriptional regulator [Anaerolineae bacterium]